MDDDGNDNDDRIKVAMLILALFVCIVAVAWAVNRDEAKIEALTRRVQILEMDKR